MKLIVQAIFVFLLLPAGIFSQVNCNNPIQLNNIFITPSCGGDNGAIYVNLPDGNYAWTWLPAVSNSQQAFGLAAGDYLVHIQRIDEPDCSLDTLITVNSYPDAPMVQVSDVQPATCLSSTGSATLSPATYYYEWSNTEIGAINDGLNSGIYGVTATDPATGCRTTLSVTIPNNNPLQLEATVLYPSKCGRSTGEASFSVSGGSGQYAYSLGGTQVSGLPAGPGSGIVVDITNGCADTAFFEVPVLYPEAVVNVKTNAPRCYGEVGNIEVEVFPGTNFKLPYTFSVTLPNGTPIPEPDSIFPGNYLIYVADADSCVLPGQVFTMDGPPALVSTAAITPGNCLVGGTINLSVTGGTGGYLTDWLDLNGTVNPNNRTQLATGRYAAIVYDSLFCKDTISDLLITNSCAARDTFHLLVPKGGSNTFCIDLPVGFLAGEATYSLINGSTSAYGSWTLNSNCLTYNAFQTPGFDLDLICIKVQNQALNTIDTVCIRVSILQQAPTQETVYFTAQINTTAASCGTIPPAVTGGVVTGLNIAGLSGVTANGTFSIHTTDACMAYSAFNTPQFFADSIAISVCNSAQFTCHIISYVPSILPYSDCSNGILAADSITLPTVSCLVGAATCLDIPYANILNFSILDNSIPYTQGALGCNEATVSSYAVNQIPSSGNLDGGPYHLDEWQVDGTAHTGNFGDLNELLALMNQIDPVPGWYLENFLNLIGGDPSVHSYGPLRITSAQNISQQIPAALKTAALGSELRFSTGEHFVILKKIQTGCSDTLKVNVQCFDCPPIHGYPLDFFGNIEWEAPSCAGDTVFVTNIPAATASQWVFQDNSQPLLPITQAGMVAFRLDTGYHLMQLRNTITTCNYFVSFYSDCRNAPVDTITVVLKVGEELAVCPDQSLLPAPIITIFHICPEKNAEPNATITYDETNWCALLQGTVAGLDTLCLQLCNADGICATTLVFVEVQPLPDNAKVLIYNALSPNGDQKNDLWHILGIGNFPQNKVWVYNRWGNEVFHQANYANDWDGTWNNQLLPNGTYYYVVDLGDGSEILKGSLSIGY